MPIDDRYSVDDHVEGLIDMSIRPLLSKALADAYEAGRERGADDQIEEYEESGPVAMLIATVKEFQGRCLDFEPLPLNALRPYFYDNLIRFLESGELPPEWQP